MSPEKKLKEKQKLMALVKEWPKRLRKLRKLKNMKENQFCDAHGINKFSFNRQKRRKCEPRKKAVMTVEAAFKKEGV